MALTIIILTILLCALLIVPEIAKRYSVPIIFIIATICFWFIILKLIKLDGGLNIILQICAIPLVLMIFPSNILRNVGKFLLFVIITSVGLYYVLLVLTCGVLS